MCVHVAASNGKLKSTTYIESFIHVDCRYFVQYVNASLQ